MGYAKHFRPAMFGSISYIRKYYTNFTFKLQSKHYFMQCIILIQTMGLGI